MPELPEVETIRLQLDKFLVGHVIESVDIKISKIFPTGSKKIIGTKIKSVQRLAKIIVINLSNNYHLGSI